MMINPESSRRKGIIWAPSAAHDDSRPMPDNLIAGSEPRHARSGRRLTDPAVQAQPTTLPVAQPDSDKVAIVLNANAKRVTKGVLRAIWRLMGKDHVYYSHSIDEAEGFVREIVQKGYGTVMCGGGDGTLTHVINLLYRYIDESNRWRRLLHERTGEVQPLIGYPRIGSLKLGTGNGLSGVLGTGSAIGDLVAVLENKVERTVRVPMIVSEDEYFFFGGMGYDAQLLNDYNWVKEHFTNPFTRLLTVGLTGYFTALFTRMLPRALLAGASVEMRVVNSGQRCFYIDPRRGDRLLPVEPGAVLHEGRVTMVGAGTTPFYGYGFHMYPFAGLGEGLMNLRVADIGPLPALLNLPAIWRGTYRDHRTVRDFLCDGVTIEVARPFPYQHSGEGKGYREALSFALSDRQVEFLDFHQPVL